MSVRVILTFALGVLLCLGIVARIPASKPSPRATKSFSTRGVVKEVNTGSARVVVQHEEIPEYMPAMTMPFHAKSASELMTLRKGDVISFRLHVTETESWIEQIMTVQGAPKRPEPAIQPDTPPASPKSEHPLKAFRFTDELGRVVCLNDFRGQALAITFFFTRCPIPEYCPRLSKNFQVASQKLLALPDAPTNWHFISVSFDTEFDTPAVLKAYAKGYQYDPRHWSFWTGPADEIRELASLSDAQYERDGGLFTHNFRTLIVDAAGRLQMSFPIGGDLSDSLVAEIVRAADQSSSQ